MKVSIREAQAVESEMTWEIHEAYLGVIVMLSKQTIIYTIKSNV